MIDLVNSLPLHLYIHCNFHMQSFRYLGTVIDKLHLLLPRPGSHWDLSLILDCLARMSMNLVAVDRPRMPAGPAGKAASVDLDFRVLGTSGLRR